MALGIVILIIILACVLLYIYFRYTKRLAIDNVYFISGGVKTGKSFISVALAIKTYKKNVRRYYLIGWLFKVLYLFTRKEKFKDCGMKPMLYSNIPLRYVKFNPLTLDIVKRRVRIPNKSVVLIDETSLLADSMLFNDKKLNNQLLLFYKLWGHYSHGGTLVCNSQAISDNHFSLKRCMSHYLYIRKRSKYPFISIFDCREMLYSDDNNLVNNSNEDLELSTRKVWFLNRYYKYYDCYCYSIFTDSLSYQVDYDKPILKLKDSLKTDNLVSLQDFSNLDMRLFAKRQKQAKVNFAKGILKDEKE